MRSGTAPHPQPPSPPPPSASIPATPLPAPLSPRQVAPNEDPPQGVLFPVGHHWGADLQVSEGVQATHRAVLRLPSHIAEIWTLMGETESGWLRGADGHDEELEATFWVPNSLKAGQGWLPILQMEILSQRLRSDLFNISSMHKDQGSNTQALWPGCHVRACHSPWSQGDSREGPGCSCTAH